MNTLRGARGKKNRMIPSERDNPRLLATRVLTAVIDEGRSLNDVLADALDRVDARDRGWLQEVGYGTLRWCHQLDYFLQQLLGKPLKQRDRDLHMLLLSGLYQLLYLRTPSYAAVSASVAVARDLNKPWAAKLVNAVLRNFDRQREALLADSGQLPAVQYSHPAWLLQRLQKDWPQHWQNIARANNQHPPQSLRINLSKITRAGYLQQLADAGLGAEPVRYVPCAVTLAQPVNVKDLPGFEQGLVSVQDSAAQLAALLLDLQPQQRVLDACAAPGGKSCHILEHTPSLRLVALDNDAVRLAKLQQNLQRLHLSADIITADAAQTQQWWDGQPFDRILLDAPCSATGVIRRHPDIKLLRRNSDITSLGEQQYRLLERLWLLLKPGGRLLYATCSVLHQENSEVIRRFCDAYPNAREQHFEGAGWGRACDYGRQILPGEDGMDGFYYACLAKHSGL